jgi:hypothetical protein
VETGDTPKSCPGGARGDNQDESRALPKPTRALYARNGVTQAKQPSSVPATSTTGPVADGGQLETISGLQRLLKGRSGAGSRPPWGRPAFRSRKMHRVTRTARHLTLRTLFMSALMESSRVQGFVERYSPSTISSFFGERNQDVAEGAVE